MKKMSFVVAVLGLLTSCGSDKLSRQDAELGFTAAQTAMTTAWASAKPAGALTSEQALNGGVDYSGSCPQSGTVALSGTYDVDLAGTGVGDLGVVFTDCAVSEQGVTVTVGGSTDWNMSVTSTATTFKWTGDLTFSGDFSGSCAVDVTATVNYGGGNYGFTYSGTICGYDAGDTMGG